jgi:HEAT repeat protein
MGLLWQIGGAALPPLVEQLARAKTIRQRRLLADTIAGFGDAAIPHLLKPLADERWFVARNAVTILGDIGDPLAIPVLEPVASHPDPRISKEVMKSLGRIGSSDARAILERHLKHGHGDTQLLAAFAIGLTRDPEAIPALVAALARPLLLARCDLQREVIKALAKIGTPAVVPALGRIFLRRALVSRRKTEDLREAAAQALARINSEASRALLQQGLSARNAKVAAICRAALSEPNS